MSVDGLGRGQAAEVMAKRIGIGGAVVGAVAGGVATASSAATFGSGGAMLGGAVLGALALGILGAAGGAIAGAATGRDLGPRGTMPSLVKPGLALGAAAGGIVALTAMRGGRGADTLATYIATGALTTALGIGLGAGAGAAGGWVLTAAGNVAGRVGTS